MEVLGGTGKVFIIVTEHAASLLDLSLLNFSLMREGGASLRLRVEGLIRAEMFNFEKLDVWQEAIQFADV